MLLAILSFVLLIIGLLHYNPILTQRVTYDYFVWASTLLSLISVYGELRRLRNKPLYSTVLLLIVGGVFIVEGRFMSMYYNSFKMGYFGGLVGENYTIDGFNWSLLVLAGSFIVMATNLLHVLGGGVIFIKPQPILLDAYTGLIVIARRITGVFEKYTLLVVLVVWFFAFTYRFIPELYWWPWLIGWDTPEYVAHLMDYVEKLNPFTSYYWMGDLRNTPPLLVVLLSPFTLIADAWSIFKVYPSVAYGFLASLSALIVIKVYKKNWVVGLLAGFFTALYILNLRISWDYQRQLLGSVVMLTTILLLEKWSRLHTTRQAVIVTILLVACGLSMEVTGLVGFILSLVLLYSGLKHRDKYSVVCGLIGLVANTVLEVWYWRRPYSVVEEVGVLPLGLVKSFEYSQVVSYLVAGYGITLPLVFLAITRYKRPYVTSTITVLLLAGISPLIAPYSSVATWYRFLIGAAPLVSTLTIIGLADFLKSKWSVILYLIIASLPGLAFTYGYNWSQDYYRALREFPSMLIPAPANSKLLDTLNFFRENNNLAENTTIIAHPDYARYIHIAIRNPDPSRLIWWWSRTISNKTVCEVVERAGVEKVIIVGYTINANIEDYRCLEELRPLSNETPWIYLGVLRKQ